VLLASGSGSMDPNNLALNVEVGGGVGHDFANSQVLWNQSAALSPINGAQLADLGPIGASGYHNVTCSQLKTAAYGVASVPVAVGEVLLVKTPAGHLAKVLITSVLPADNAPMLQWQTYHP
jgi:hypothetical protein